MDFMDKSSLKLKLGSGKIKRSRHRDWEHACLPEIQNPGRIPQRYLIVQAEGGDIRRPIIPRGKRALETNQA
jgi:hypothetical protein